MPRFPQGDSACYFSRGHDLVEEASEVQTNGQRQGITDHVFIGPVGKEDSAYKWRNVMEYTGSIAKMGINCSYMKRGVCGLWL